jgi:hypothetical protein
MPAHAQPNATRPTNAPSAQGARARPTPVQLGWLRRGLDQPGGKLPLFDEYGQRIQDRTIRSCIAQGWAEPWFDNPIKPDWLVCKLTETGRAVLR